MFLESGAWFSFLCPNLHLGITGSSGTHPRGSVRNTRRGSLWPLGPPFLTSGDRPHPAPPSGDSSSFPRQPNDSCLPERAMSAEDKLLMRHRLRKHKILMKVFPNQVGADHSSPCSPPTPPPCQTAASVPRMAFPAFHGSQSGPELC